MTLEPRPLALDLILWSLCRLAYAAVMVLPDHGWKVHLMGWAGAYAYSRDFAAFRRDTVFFERTRK